MSPRALTQADYEALASFRYALRRFLRFSEQAARNAGLTPAQHQLLLAVKGTPDPEGPTLSAVAELLQLKLHSCSELVDRAAERDLIERTSDPDDQRRCRLVLTPTGEEHLARLSVAHRQELRSFRREMIEALGALEDA
jgi:DNA-binding MarR family transcriptional regulator